MSQLMPLANALSIRKSGRDERWLQDQIYENPACLGLGELVAVERERRQPTGGRIDILLKDPDDDSMYEVEIMLGETDETHIVRTIEYWDNEKREKRRWPQRQHFAVLIAERINRRFFNVIHLLSYSIPIIAILASLLECNGMSSLFFTRVLDTYEEIDDGTTAGGAGGDRNHWLAKATWTVEAADALLVVVGDLLAEPTLNFLAAYVAVTVAGNNYFWLTKHYAPKSSLCFRIMPSDESDAASLLDEHGVPYQWEPKHRFMRITADKQLIEGKRTLLRGLTTLVKKRWEKPG